MSASQESLPHPDGEAGLLGACRSWNSASTPGTMSASTAGAPSRRHCAWASGRWPFFPFAPDPYRKASWPLPVSWCTNPSKTHTQNCGSPARYIPVPLSSLLAEPGSSDAEAMREAVRTVTRSQRPVNWCVSGSLVRSLRCSGCSGRCVVLARSTVRSGCIATTSHLRCTSLSLFTISWRDTNMAPRGVTAARAVTSAKGHSHIAFEELPCGPAVLSETTLRHAAESPLPQLPLLQVHAHLPHPDCKRMAVFTVSTGAVGRREEYRGLLRGIVETVRFEGPLGAVP
ncbi:hypothetical protein STENM36S_08106 [Streptomyces tendae]